MTTRAEHLKWAKDRALEYADAGNAGGCMSSLMSDLRKHPETADSAAIVPDLMLPLILADLLDNPVELRRFVEGFQ